MLLIYSLPLPSQLLPSLKIPLAVNLVNLNQPARMKPCRNPNDYLIIVLISAISKNKKTKNNTKPLAVSTGSGSQTVCILCPNRKHNSKFVLRPSGETEGEGELPARREDGGVLRSRAERGRPGGRPGVGLARPLTPEGPEVSPTSRAPAGSEREGRRGGAAAPPGSGSRSPQVSLVPVPNSRPLSPVNVSRVGSGTRRFPRTARRCRRTIT